MHEYPTFMDKYEILDQLTSNFPTDPLKIQTDPRGSVRTTLRTTDLYLIEKVYPNCSRLANELQRTRNSNRSNLITSPFTF